MKNWHDAYAKGRALLDKHGLGDWDLSIENMFNPNFYPTGEKCGLMGCCDEKNKTIRVNWQVGLRHFRQTLLHEIAHALTPNDSDHGEQWLEVAWENQLQLPSATSVHAKVKSRLAFRKPTCKLER